MTDLPINSQPSPPMPPAPSAVPIAPFGHLSHDNQRSAGALVHLLGLIGGFGAAWFAYLVLRHRGHLLRSHAATTLNLNLTWALGVLVAYPLLLVPVVNVLVCLVVGLATVARLVFAIVAAQKAYRGEFYQIPGAIRFVK